MFSANKNFLDVASIFVVIVIWYVIAAVNVHAAHLLQLLVHLKISTESSGRSC